MDMLMMTPLRDLPLSDQFEALRKSWLQEQGLPMEDLARQAIAALLPPEEPARRGEIG